jgi:hypothetical protein
MEERDDYVPSSIATIAVSCVALLYVREVSGALCSWSYFLRSGFSVWVPLLDVDTNRSTVILIQHNFFL